MRPRVQNGLKPFQQKTSIVGGLATGLKYWKLGTTKNGFAYMFVY